MLEARALHKVYRNGRQELPVLRGVSLQVAAGEFIAITGPSGAGKSTLLHLLAGLDAPTSGEVVWQGASLLRMDDAARAAFRNRTVGIVFQFYHLLPELTALENVMLPMLVSGSRRRGSLQALRRRAAQGLDQVGLSARAHHKPGALSGGELQRVAIARALINEPPLLFCDEPTGNLDSHTGAAVAELLMAVHQRRGMSLVLVTHEAELAALADRTIGLRDGRIVSEERSVRSGA